MINPITTNREKVNISFDVRQIVYSFLKASDLILLVSKLNSQERRCLKEHRNEVGGDETSGYALNSSINKKKAMFKMLETSQPIRLNEIVSLTLPKVPLSRFC